MMPPQKLEKLTKRQRAEIHWGAQSVLAKKTKIRNSDDAIKFSPENHVRHMAGPFFANSEAPPIEDGLKKIASDSSVMEKILQPCDAAITENALTAASAMAVLASVACKTSMPLHATETFVSKLPLEDPYKDSVLPCWWAHTHTTQDVVPAWLPNKSCIQLPLPRHHPGSKVPMQNVLPHKDLGALMARIQQVDSVNWPASQEQACEPNQASLLEEVHAPLRKNWATPPLQTSYSYAQPEQTSLGQPTSPVTVAMHAHDWTSHATCPRQTLESTWLRLAPVAFLAPTAAHPTGKTMA
jgi:hypothetical protein